jgi:serine/threonine protein kinase/tetratricopeptide (TPR) repeat protein
MGPQSIDRIFWDAAQIASTGERNAYLDRACADDRELRRRVEQLLQAQAQAESFLESPVSDLGDTPQTPPLAPSLPPFLGPGARDPGATVEELPGVGPYKLLEQIGEGTFGVVYLAEQKQPVRRRVALKVLKPGMDTRQVVARFEAERQALALMDHPNIAKVFDGGETPSGRPFFVMELVRGAPITEFCDEKRLTIRERLGLFASVCAAVQHAHQKGLIHRDLKPSNVLVTLQDGAAVPKVIDFGVAKALGQQLTDKTLCTGFAQVVGTPLYMSPEQARLSGLDVDTRADVYSLGALLYELLTGTTPLEKERARRLDLDELRRAIREEEPPRPSARAAAAGEAATRRQSDPRRLSQLLRGELDWVVMQALEKDRDRRYESPSALAADVQHYLHDEPVHACPPSRWYRFRKLVRRNRGAFLAAGLVLLTLVGGIIATGWQAVRATRAKQLAQTRLGQIEKVNDVLTSIFSDLDPSAEDQGGPKLQEQLRRRLVGAAQQLDGEAIGDRLTVARSQYLLAYTLNELGDYHQAIELFEKARATWDELLGRDADETLQSMNALGDAYGRDGQFDKAVSLFEQTLERRKALLGPDHRETLLSKRQLAFAYQRAGQRKQALELFVEVLEKRKALLGPDHRGTLMSMNDLASAYQGAGRLDLAVPLYVETVEKWKATVGPEALDTLNSMNNLATAYVGARQLDKAIPLHQEVLEKRKARLDASHPAVLFSMNNLAMAYQTAGQPEKAVPLLEEAVERFKAKLGPDHHRTLGCMNNLALAYDGAGRLDKAVPLYEQSLQGHKAKLGPGHPTTLLDMNNLAAAYGRTGQFDRAAPLFAEALRLQKENPGPDHPSTLLTMVNLGVCYRDTGRLAEGTALLEGALDLAQKRQGGFPPGLSLAFSNLGWAYDKAGQFTRGEPLHRESLKRLEKLFGPEDARTGRALAGLGENLLKQERYAESEAALRRCLTIRAKKSPDDWPTFHTRSLLGGALLGQKKYAEAGPLLREGYEGLKQRDKKLLPHEKARLGEAAERLVRLYEATGETEKAAEWAKTLEAHRAAAKKAEGPR